MTSLYIPVKLNEPVYDVSVMRILKNCQWKFSIDLFIINNHTYISLL